ncbi:MULTISPECIES: hypothetical protein [unclassified Polaribacter]|nr:MULTISPECIES: hypothetical protein [unclassified Polaribacter]
MKIIYVIKQVFEIKYLCGILSQILNFENKKELYPEKITFANTLQN